VLGIPLFDAVPSFLLSPLRKVINSFLQSFESPLFAVDV